MTPPRTKQVTAQLYQAARDLNVKAGQYVMVVADVVVGIYTGEQAVPIAPQPEGEDTQPVKKEGRGGGDRNKKDGKPLRTVVPIILQIATMAHKQDWFSVPDIMDTLAKSGVDNKEWRVRDATQWLKNNRWLIAKGNQVTRQYKRGPYLPPLERIDEKWRNAA